jgi:hypothetical protein
MKASIRIDANSLAGVQLMLSGVKNGYPRAMSRAINKGLATARVEARKKVQEEVTVSTKYVNRAITEEKATYTKLTGCVEAKGDKGLPLVAYEHSQTNKGVMVRIDRGGNRTLWPGAFEATMKNVVKNSGDIVEHKGLFSRKKTHIVGSLWKAGRRIKVNKAKVPEKYRLPIKQLYGPSIPAIFKRKPILDHVQKQASLRAEDELARQVELLLR